MVIYQSQVSGISLNGYLQIVHKLNITLYSVISIKHYKTKQVLVSQAWDLTTSIMVL